MKKQVWMLSLLVVLCIAIQSQAAYVQWNGAAGTSDWNTPGNWATGTVPGMATLDKAGFKSATGPVVTYATPQCNQWTLGGSSGGFVTVGAGGELSTASYIIMGNSAGENGTLTMNGGTITTGGNFYAGYGGTGTIFMSGGTITVGGTFGIAHKAGAGATSTGSVYLNGGTITASAFSMANAGAGSTAFMNITHGTLIIDGDQRSLISGYGNMIKAYGGTGTVNVDYDDVTDKSTVSAIHALDPQPADNGMVNADLDLLHWTLPEPNSLQSILTCDVRLSDDPNFADNPPIAPGSTGDTVDVVLTTKTQYYWQIIVYDSDFGTDPVMGPIVFKFNTFQAPPTANAGDDVETWLSGGPMEVQLDGGINDPSGGPVEPTFLWTVTEDTSETTPAEIINDTAPDAKVMITEAGTYTLQLEVVDNEYTITDTMQITVYADSCEHALNQEGFVRLAGDANDDCKVDLMDLADVAATWLEENFSIEILE